MYRSGLRSSPRALRAFRQSSLVSSVSRPRFLTTTPAEKRRTWKGFALRWGLAIAAVYWYNTSPIFADEPTSRAIAPPPQFSDSDLPTVDTVIEEKRRQAGAATPPPPPEPSPQQQQQETAMLPPAEESPVPGSPEALETEAGQQGAFDPETGEINWDCPCLGGMAHGPCGEEFKAAFSCFVHSREEPKGMDCIDKFQHMQDCFRQYPEIYGAELQDDEESNQSSTPVAGAEPAGAGDALPEASKEPGLIESAQKIEKPLSTQLEDKTETPTREPRRADEQEKIAEVIPRGDVGATDANKGGEQS